MSSVDVRPVHSLKDRADYLEYGVGLKKQIHCAAGTDRLAVMYCSLGSIDDFVERGEALAEAHGRTVQAQSYLQNYEKVEFKVTDPEDLARVNDLGYELASRMDEREGIETDHLVVTHADADGGHAHNHIVRLNHDNLTGQGIRKFRTHGSVKKLNDELMREQGLRTVADRQQEIALGLEPGALTPAHKEQVAALGLEQRLVASVRTTQADYWARKRGTLKDSEQSFDMRLSDAVTAAMLDPGVTDDDELVASLRRVKVAGAPDAKRDGITMTVDPKTRGTKFRMWNQATKRYNYRSASKLSPMLTTDGRGQVFADKAHELQAVRESAAVTRPTIDELYARAMAGMQDTSDLVPADLDFDAIYPPASAYLLPAESQETKEQETKEQETKEQETKEQETKEQETKEQETKEREARRRHRDHIDAQIESWRGGDLRYGDLEHEAQREVAAGIAGRDVPPATWDRLSDAEIKRRVDAVQARLLAAEQEPEVQAVETASVPAPTAATTTAPATGSETKRDAKRRRELQVKLQASELRDRELVVLVMGEKDGHMWLDVQLAAHDPAAHDQMGLHLRAQRHESVVDGQPRTRVSTATPYGREQVDKLRAAAGGNRTVVDGQQVLALRGSVMPAVRGRGYVVGHQHSLAPSDHHIGREVIERQHASEDRARANRPTGGGNPGGGPSHQSEQVPAHRDEQPDVTD
ncbi:relaxase/mobilization nuclease domain-containing protein [Actinomycetota bacterium]